MVEELLKKDDVNVFVVIWSRGARGIYHQAAGNTRIVGEEFSRKKFGSIYYKSGHCLNQLSEKSIDCF